MQSATKAMTIFTSATAISPTKAAELVRNGPMLLVIIEVNFPVTISSTVPTYTHIFYKRPVKIFSFFPEEQVWHNQCRTIRLNNYQRVPRYSNASAHVFVDFDGWSTGPWCYVMVCAFMEIRP